MIPAQGHTWGSDLCLIPQEKSSGRTAHYKLTSTVMLWLQTNKSGSGTMNLGGSLTRQVGSPLPTPERGPGAASVSDRISPPEIQRFGLESFYLWVKVFTFKTLLGRLGHTPDNIQNE